MRNYKHIFRHDLGVWGKILHGVENNNITQFSVPPYLHGSGVYRLQHFNININTNKNKQAFLHCSNPLLPLHNPSYAFLFPMGNLRKYGSGLTNKVFALLLVLAFLYIITMYTWTSTHPFGLHADDSHKDLHITDEIIIILGYKLHADGMATRVLRDRVERATTLYHELMAQGHHPLIIVSGKGKNDNGYTEAEAMMDLCTLFGVRKTDVLVDSESTNTAQNAKFSAELIKNRKDINEVYVVTSDYHVPRAQYLFQTVFPRYLFFL